ncbi:MAG TPA: hypothetical protein VEC14_01135 [Reyranellaceae bacterium]|nr:hypothetical protein [Reyranellaceae bacterium]
MSARTAQLRRAYEDTRYCAQRAEQNLRDAAALDAAGRHVDAGTLRNLAAVAAGAGQRNCQRVMQLRGAKA